MEKDAPSTDLTTVEYKGMTPFNAGLLNGLIGWELGKMGGGVVERMTGSPAACVATVVCATGLLAHSGWSEAKEAKQQFEQLKAAAMERDVLKGQLKLMIEQSEHKGTVTPPNSPAIAPA